MSTDQDYFFQRLNKLKCKKLNKRREVYYKIFVDGLLAFVFPANEINFYKKLLKSKGVRLENSNEEEYENFTCTNS